jgi:Phytoene/squalene synthetase
LTSQDLLIHRETIGKGSKSFALASLLFSKRQKESAWKLYSWCRFCDDQVDNVPADSAADRLRYLENATKNVMLDENSILPFRGLKDVIEHHQLPQRHPLELLRGMRMDVEGRRYQTLAELEEYCYCVAGVVGLMMCSVMGVKSEQAYPHAVAMGNAMQLTNICRDIREDYQRGRIYLPLEWLNEKSLNAENLLNPENEMAVVELQERLLQRADELYRQGYAGLKYLSFRSAWAVLVAAKVYSHIGVLIRKSPSRSLRERTIVSLSKKIFLVLGAVPRMIWSYR